MFENFKEGVKTLFTPRGQLGRVGQNLCFGLALLGLILFYTYLASGEENTLFPSWGELFAGASKLIYNPDLEEYMLWEDSIASFKRLIPAVGLFTQTLCDISKLNPY